MTTSAVKTASRTAITLPISLALAASDRVSRLARRYVVSHRSTEGRLAAHIVEARRLREEGAIDEVSFARVSQAIADAREHPHDEAPSYRAGDRLTQVPH